MLSDDRYAEMRIRLRAPRYGNTRLHQELSQKVSTETPLLPYYPSNRTNSPVVAIYG